MGGRIKKHPDIPPKHIIRQQVKAIGCWREYVRARDTLKTAGVLPADAEAQTYRQMQIAQKWAMHEERKAVEQREPLESAVVSPTLRPAAIPTDVEIGEEELTLPQQIQWVQERVGNYRFTGELPKRFPSQQVAYWWQEAAARPDKFQERVIKFLAPHSEEDEELMRDGEYQLREVERQLAAARDEALRDSAQDADLELTVPP